MSRESSCFPPAVGRHPQTPSVIPAHSRCLHAQEEPCTFDLLVYTDQETAVPRTWEESDPRYIVHSAEVKLRSFTTTIHKVAPTVSYRAPAGE